MLHLWMHLHCRHLNNAFMHAPRVRCILTTGWGNRTDSSLGEPAHFLSLSGGLLTTDLWFAQISKLVRSMRELHNSHNNGFSLIVTCMSKADISHAICSYNYAVDLHDVILWQVAVFPLAKSDFKTFILFSISLIPRESYVNLLTVQTETETIAWQLSWYWTGI